MHPHERAFVEAFLKLDRQERFLEALANPKRRGAFHRELHHPKPGFFDERFIERIAPSRQSSEFVAAQLRRLGANDECWVFGNHIDGRQMNLDTVLKELLGIGTGTIVSCLPGKLAFFEGEEERLILYR